MMTNRQAQTKAERMFGKVGSARFHGSREESLYLVGDGLNKCFGSGESWGEAFDNARTLLGKPMLFRWRDGKPTGKPKKGARRAR